MSDNGQFDLPSALLTHLSVQAIGAAIRGGIFDQIAENQLPVVNDADTRTLTGGQESHRILPILKHLDLIVFDPDSRQFKLSDKAAFWIGTKASPGVIRNMTLLMTSKHVHGAWNELHQSFNQGVSGWELAFGESWISTYSAAPNEARTFNDAMDEQSRIIAAYLREIISSSTEDKFKSVLDLGGGSGTLLSELSKSVEFSEMAVLDRPFVEPLFERARGLDGHETGTFRFIPGSFFSEIPQGFDLLILKMVLHDWSDQDCIRILSKISASMSKTAHSRLLIIDRCLPHDPDAIKELDWALNDLHMLAVCGGKERRIDEFNALSKQSNLQVTNLTPLNDPFQLSVIEMRAV